MRYLSEYGVVAWRGAHASRQLSFMCFVDHAHRDRRGDDKPPFLAVMDLMADVAGDGRGWGTWMAGLLVTYGQTTSAAMRNAAAKPRHFPRLLVQRSEDAECFLPVGVET